ncbi:hypothetical protein KAFR_0D01790 [Kazachstania africana CBS 2517]|uniref:E3 ubiquitin-protein ligase n=1 Tax=Kazachstania africana (strain ATCC 22294 / BCRC 22015 / CBS 2517 / CECT 1963 / NBRC 1671 / NRRL Y-8276) TaxID=1071382 RepID=H2ATX6_KAZAF|nr:hypothetical protein KAFR_0D01790 [Kazachstania africana CBS 2517]CCF57826.1 hypothetical protein KAFR_0D01790 [Kazachstania africana CBS 2517]
MRDEQDLRNELYTTLRSIHKLQFFQDVRGPTARIEMDHLLKQIIFKFLYFEITDNGTNLSKLFPNSPDYPTSIDDFLNDTNITNEFYKIDMKQKQTSFTHKGRNCGRKFKVGEPLYRCHECGFDDTCVLCIHCFNPADHENHHIYTDICNDFTSGICDCGDTEAWNGDLHCKAEEISTEDKDDTMDDEASDNVSYDEKVMEIVLSEAFDYFIDLFNQNVEPLPTFTKEITMKLREMIQMGQVDEMNKFLISLSYKNEFIEEAEEAKNYTVLIYNDEFHNYSQATMALRQGVPDNIHTDILTSKIDSEGRAMLKCSDDIQTLTDGFFNVQSNGLSATFTSWSEYVHQEACKYIVHWLNHCLTIPDNDFQHMFRNALGKVLCLESPNLPDKNSMIPTLEEFLNMKLTASNALDIHYPYRFIDLSILNNHNKIPLGFHKTLTESSTKHISTGLNEHENITDRKYANTRLQYLLYFDNRYWKKLRKDLQNVIIPTLSSSQKYKPTFCQQVVEIFNHMTRSIAYMDREPQLTALRECVVQLFTCPTNAKMIFENENNYFIDIVWSIIDIFAEFCKFDEGNFVWQKVTKSNPTKSLALSFKQGLYTVETLLSKIDNPNIIMRPKEFISIVTLCKLFNGAWKIKRKEGEHVLHEDQSFIPYLEYTTSIYSIIQTIENTLNDNMFNEQLLLNSIKLLNSYLSHRSLTYKLVKDSYEVVKFTVSSDRVAYMNPIHTFFSFLIEKVPLAKGYEAILYQDALSTTTVEDHAETAITHDVTFDFLKISDFSLRTIVLCSQISVGFWVRNGMSVLHQASYYRNNPELNTYSRDIYLNQLALLWESDDLPRVIYNILDRWELLEWFNGDVAYESTVYQDKITLIMQQFISFLYQLLTERQFFQKFSSAEERKMFYIKNAIIYNLYSKPLSYSKLLKKVPDYLTENTTDFDSALNEVSIFIEPKGLADNGVFKLKESLYSKIDPLKLLNLENEFESSATVIKTHLAKNTKDDVTKVILQPQITSLKHMDEEAAELGAFTRSTIFAKIIYKLLQVCLDTEDGTFLNELLHLIHGIFRDDEMVNGKSSLPNAFLSKPICNLLLSIAVSKTENFSGHITSKANYLLQKMINKNSNEVFDSLIASFGTEYVEEYKAKSHTSGADLEESEKERKKRLAKKRQAKLLAKFNNQQSKFMKEHEDEFEEKNDYDDEDVDMLEGEKIVEVEDFTCSLCQDAQTQDVFVIPSYHDYTPIFRPGNIIDAKEFATSWEGFTNDNEHPTYMDEELLDSLQIDGNEDARKVFVSCNHHIHHNCFRRYIQKKRFSSTAFICPLCQTYSNCIIPVHQTSSSDTSLTVDLLLEGDSHTVKLSECFKPFNTGEFNNIFDVFDAVFSDSQSFDKRYHKNQDFGKGVTALVLANHWTNTICMLEVASRWENLPHKNFLVGKEQKYKTLKNILVFIILIVSNVSSPAPTDKVYVNNAGHIYNQNQLFQYITRQVLFSDETTVSIITDALNMYSVQFLKDFFLELEGANIDDLYEEAISLGTVYKYDQKLLGLLNMTCGAHFSMPLFSDELKTKIFNLAYSSLLKNLLPSLRRCLIMLKVFHLLLDESESSPFTIKNINLEKDIYNADEFQLPQYIDRLIFILTNFETIGEFLNGRNISQPFKNEDLIRNVPHEYTGIVKLADLSQYLNTYVTNAKALSLREENKNTKNSTNRLDFKICLTCGVKIHQRSDRHEMSKHLTRHCFKPFSAFLIPNTSEICLFLSKPASSICVAAPYLNSHGESGRNAMKRGDLTMLNLKRYEHLNKLWINNEIPGYISRVMGDEFRVSILSNGFLFAFNGEGRARRVPPTNASDDESEDFPEGGDEDDFESDDDDDERFGEGFNHINIPPGGDVRDFFQIFETVRNAMEDNGANPNEGVDLTTPFLQFFGPQFRGARRDNGDQDDDNVDDDRNSDTEPAW